MSIPPVLLIIFNRPDKADACIEALRAARPARLYVAADGPRADRPEDAERCERTRSIVSKISWPCEVRTRFLEKNLGCGIAVSSAITWLFEHEEAGIILEDDCIPHRDFFPFCEDLLGRYSHDGRIMRIAGFTPYPKREHPYDYHFSRRFYCWGWATWRRAWRHFVYDLDAYDEEDLGEMLKAYFPFYHRRRSCIDTLRQIRSGLLRTWAFRWDIACFSQNGLAIVPETNLIRNTGVGDEEATHTRRKNPVFADLECGTLEFPLRHPPFVYHDGRPDQAFEGILQRNRSLRNRITYRLRHIYGAMDDFWQTIP